jgi:hypothetical protein
MHCSQSGRPRPQPREQARSGAFAQRRTVRLERHPSERQGPCPLRKTEDRRTAWASVPECHPKSGENRLMIFAQRPSRPDRRGFLCVVAATVAAAILSVSTGCGTGSSGRVGIARGPFGAWNIWVSPSGRRLYVRIPEPVATGLGQPCPGRPWGLVNRYGLDRRGQIAHPPGGPRGQEEAALKHAVKRARDGSKPAWMKAFDKKCRGR